MAKTKSKDHKKKDKKAAARQGKVNGKPSARAQARHKPPAKPKAAEKAASSRPAPSAKGKPDAGHGGVAAGAVAAKPPAGADGRPAKSGKPRKSSRRPTLLRRGPDGEILAPGDLLLPGGTQRSEEIQYLFRGCAAAERPNLGDEAVAEVFARRPTGEFPSDRDELQRALVWARDRFERGNIEPVIPPRTNVKRTFQGVVERARHRRREIGAFLRGLDLGHTETNHMDAHGEASLQSLMEWAARLENLTEADEPTQADYASFHRGLDQLESTTEALIIDVEQTLRRLRDRLRQ
ncbi:MAG TPA: hypothetical protein VEQ10_12890 [Vicinamibacteria bacterium]|nr:hypothetical protein [Vicinamibacteria bacterium]